MTLKVYTSVLDSEIDDAGHKLLNFVSPIGNKSESAGVVDNRMANATT
jgi:hypothetical protein